MQENNQIIDAIAKTLQLVVGGSVKESKGTAPSGEPSSSRYIYTGQAVFRVSDHPYYRHHPVADMQIGCMTPIEMLRRAARISHASLPDSGEVYIVEGGSIRPSTVDDAVRRAAHFEIGRHQSIDSDKYGRLLSDLRTNGVLVVSDFGDSGPCRDIFGVQYGRYYPQEINYMALVATERFSGGDAVYEMTAMVQEEKLERLRRLVDSPGDLCYLPMSEVVEVWYHIGPYQSIRLLLDMHRPMDYDVDGFFREKIDALQRESAPPELLNMAKTAISAYVEAANALGYYDGYVLYSAAWSALRVKWDVRTPVPY